MKIRIAFCCFYYNKYFKQTLKKVKKYYQLD